MAAIAGVSVTTWLVFGGSNKTPPAVEASTAAQAEPGKLIVHEWGTFTSFSGSNGVQLDFRPLINEDLPGFVLDRQTQAGYSMLTKARIRAQVRMETPVTYFYTDQERTVRASVEFPNGLLTEFYPPVESMLPPIDARPEYKRPFGTSKLDWGDVHLIPPASLAPAVKDEETRKWLQSMIEQRITPAAEYNHYKYARDTDSAFVHVRRSPHVEPLVVKPYGDHIEKFLFYRGVGKFDQPLKVVAAEDGTLSVTNPGAQPIRSLFRVTVSGKELSYSEMAQLEPGQTVQFEKTAVKVSLEELQGFVVAALEREKLYKREAVAMVRTWADSWFAEQGTRVFYMVPGEQTEKLLPLTISPAPDETVRVLVGRVEVMLPSVEKKLMEVVGANAKLRAIRNEEEKDKEVKTPLAVPKELLAMGRLAEPALVRIRELARDGAVSYEATLLIAECRKALEGAESLTDASE
jgi:hypothetical protein